MHRLERSSCTSGLARLQHVPRVPRCIWRPVQDRLPMSSTANGIPPTTVPPAAPNDDTKQQLLLLQQQVATMSQVMQLQAEQNQKLLGTIAQLNQQLLQQQQMLYQMQLQQQTGTSLSASGSPPLAATVSNSMTDAQLAVVSEAESQPKYGIATAVPSAPAYVETVGQTLQAGQGRRIPEEAQADSIAAAATITGAATQPTSGDVQHPAVDNRHMDKTGKKKKQKTPQTQDVGDLIADTTTAVAAAMNDTTQPGSSNVLVGSTTNHLYEAEVGILGEAENKQPQGGSTESMTPTEQPELVAQTHAEIPAVAADTSQQQGTDVVQMVDAAGVPIPPMPQAPSWEEYMKLGASMMVAPDQVKPAPLIDLTIQPAEHQQEADHSSNVDAEHNNQVTQHSAAQKASSQGPLEPAHTAADSTVAAATGYDTQPDLGNLQPEGDVTKPQFPEATQGSTRGIEPSLQISAPSEPSIEVISSLPHAPSWEEYSKPAASRLNPPARVAVPPLVAVSAQQPPQQQQQQHSAEQAQITKAAGGPLQQDDATKAIPPWPGSSSQSAQKSLKSKPAAQPTMQPLVVNNLPDLVANLPALCERRDPAGTINGYLSKMQIELAQAHMDLLVKLLSQLSESGLTIQSSNVGAICIGLAPHIDRLSADDTCIVFAALCQLVPDTAERLTVRISDPMHGVSFSDILIKLLQNLQKQQANNPIAGKAFFMAQIIIKHPSVYANSASRASEKHSKQHMASGLLSLFVAEQHVLQPSANMQDNVGVMACWQALGLDATQLPTSVVDTMVAATIQQLEQQGNATAEEIATIADSISSIKYGSADMHATHFHAAVDTAHTWVRVIEQCSMACLSEINVDHAAKILNAFLKANHSPSKEWLDGVVLSTLQYLPQLPSNDKKPPPPSKLKVTITDSKPKRGSPGNASEDTVNSSTESNTAAASGRQTTLNGSALAHLALGIALLATEPVEADWVARLCLAVNANRDTITHPGLLIDALWGISTLGGDPASSLYTTMYMRCVTHTNLLSPSQVVRAACLPAFMATAPQAARPPLNDRWWEEIQTCATKLLTATSNSTTSAPDGTGRAGMHEGVFQPTPRDLYACTMAAAASTTLSNAGGKSGGNSKTASAAWAQTLSNAIGDNSDAYSSQEVIQLVNAFAALSAEASDVTVDIQGSFKSLIQQYEGATRDQLTKAQQHGWDKSRPKMSISTLTSYVEFLRLYGCAPSESWWQAVAVAVVAQKPVEYSPAELVSFLHMCRHFKAEQIGQTSMLDLVPADWVSASLQVVNSQAARKAMTLPQLLSICQAAMHHQLGLPDGIMHTFLSKLQGYVTKLDADDLRLAFQVLIVLKMGEKMQGPLQDELAKTVQQRLPTMPLMSALLLVNNFVELLQPNGKQLPMQLLQQLDSRFYELAQATLQPNQTDNHQQQLLDEAARYSDFDWHIVLITTLAQTGYTFPTDRLETYLEVLQPHLKTTPLDDLQQLLPLLHIHDYIPEEPWLAAYADAWESATKDIDPQHQNLVLGFVSWVMSKREGRLTPACRRLVKYATDRLHHHLTLHNPQELSAGPQAWSSGALMSVLDNIYTLLPNNTQLVRACWRHFGQTLLAESQQDALQQNHCGKPLLGEEVSVLLSSCINLIHTEWLKGPQGSEDMVDHSQSVLQREDILHMAATLEAWMLAHHTSVSPICIPQLIKHCCMWGHTMKDSSLVEMLQTVKRHQHQTKTDEELMYALVEACSMLRKQQQEPSPGKAQLIELTHNSIKSNFTDSQQVNIEAYQLGIVLEFIRETKMQVPELVQDTLAELSVGAIQSVVTATRNSPEASAQELSRYDAFILSIMRSMASVGIPERVNDSWTESVSVNLCTQLFEAVPIEYKEMMEPKMRQDLERRLRKEKPRTGQKKGKQTLTQEEQAQVEQELKRLMDQVPDMANNQLHLRCHPDVLLAFLDALSELRIKPPTFWVTAMCLAITPTLETATHWNINTLAGVFHHLTNIPYSFDLPPAFLPAAELGSLQLLPQQPQIGPGEATALFWGFCKLGHQPSAEWLNVYYARSWSTLTELTVPDMMESESNDVYSAAPSKIGGVLVTLLMCADFTQVAPNQQWMEELCKVLALSARCLTHTQISQASMHLTAILKLYPTTEAAVFTGHTEHLMMETLTRLSRRSGGPGAAATQQSSGPAYKPPDEKETIMLQKAQQVLQQATQ